MDRRTVRLQYCSASLRTQNVRLHSLLNLQWDSRGHEMQGSVRRREYDYVHG
jgi:hypothetical protein